MASMLRRSASVAAPLTMRLLGGESRHQASAGLLLSTIKNGAAASRHQQLCRRFSLSTLHLSTTEPEESVLMMSPHHPNYYEYWPLRKVLQCGIDCVIIKQYADEHHSLPILEVSDIYPFVIEDIAGEEVVKLTRQYEGETIDVEVNCVEVGDCLSFCRICGDGLSFCRICGDADEDIGPMFLTVRITKDVGPLLEFRVSADQPNIVLIKDLFLKDAKASKDSAYDHLDFGKLDEDLQNTFYKYLYVRGITSRFTNFVHDYMTHKKFREYRRWLENVKKFVEA